MTPRVRCRVPRGRTAGRRDSPKLAVCMLAFPDVSSSANRTSSSFGFAAVSDGPSSCSDGELSLAALVKGPFHAARSSLNLRRDVCN